MAEILINLTITDAQKAEFADRDFLVIPLSVAEQLMLHDNLNTIRDVLAFNLKCLSTLQQVLESTGTKEPQIAKTLQMLMDPARGAVEIMTTVRALIDRAAIVGLSQRKGRIQ